jgi:hypothetical protein
MTNLVRLVRNAVSRLAGRTPKLEPIMAPACVQCPAAFAESDTLPLELALITEDLDGWAEAAREWGHVPVTTDMRPSRRDRTEP